MKTNACRLSILLAFILLTQNAFSQSQNKRLFIMGNSTIDHRPDPSYNDETTVPHWVYLLAQTNNHTFAVGGDFGFLTNHDDLIFPANLGYSQNPIPGVWDSENEPFEDADVNALMITTANFIQYQAPDQPHPLDANTTIINSTEIIFDWVDNQEPGVTYYLYENWPEMDLMNAYPPTVPAQMEIDDYHDETTGSFHDWWIDYQDLILASRPDLNARLIPVGDILSKLQRDLIPTFPNQVAFEDMYEDSAPHGTKTLYFLASLVTYMAMYEEIAPLNFAVPSVIDPVVQNNYATIVNFIWDELINFNDANGMSRVFVNDITGATDVFLETNCITIFPNPSAGIFQVTGILADYNIDILDAGGNVFQNLNTSAMQLSVDISTLPAGLYFIRVANKTTNVISVEQIIKMN